MVSLRRSAGPLYQPDLELARLLRLRGGLCRAGGMVQQQHLCSTTLGTVPISTGGAQSVQRAEAKGLDSLATAGSKIYRRSYLAWQLHRSVSRAGPIRDFT